MIKTKVEKLNTILLYLDTYGENLTEREAKSILSRLRDIGIKEINFAEKTLQL